MRAARSLSVAVAGLFVGHLLVYRLIAPNAIQRAVLLASTGHAYLPPAVAGGAALAGIGAIASFLLAFRRGRAAIRGRSPLLWALVLPAVAQAGAFVVLEVAERLLSGVPLGGLFLILPVGIALQLAVGALGGLLLFGIDLAGEGAGQLGVRGRPAATPPRTTAVVPAPEAPAVAPRVEAFGIRGPPRAA
ncbi:MAG TPA: hypothetical protein VFW71_08425 [Actinomycetota bacterium]|nr:hypothetical protein [Actinomycetota bacterium]